DLEAQAAVDGQDAVAPAGDGVVDDLAAPVGDLAEVEVGRGRAEPVGRPAGADGRGGELAGARGLDRPLQRRTVAGAGHLRAQEVGGEVDRADGGDLPVAGVGRSGGGVLADGGG